MRIYIASSWKNQHGVEMLTALLRQEGHEVISWIENNYGENPDNSENQAVQKIDFEEWVNSPKAEQSFKFDTEGAFNCDLFIYYGRGGKDAAAECGIAYGRRMAMDLHAPIMLALHSKGEDFGLMRKMFDSWLHTYPDLIEWIREFELPK